jgi:hypothetical protein
MGSLPITSPTCTLSAAAGPCGSCPPHVRPSFLELNGVTLSAAARPGKSCTPRGLTYLNLGQNRLPCVPPVFGVPHSAFRRFSAPRMVHSAGFRRPARCIPPVCGMQLLQGLKPAHLAGNPWTVSPLYTLVPYITLRHTTARALSARALKSGVTRSKQAAMRWRRKAADNGHADACLHLAQCMYQDKPYARVVGHVVQAVSVATSDWLMERHDVPMEVLAGVLHWMRKGGHYPAIELDMLESEAREGAKHCCNQGCNVL